MLADGVEASVRSLNARDEPAIRAMVTRIIEERISDGQFDECDLTLRDIERIKNAFVEQLLGMYHSGSRIRRTRSSSWSRGGRRPVAVAAAADRRLGHPPPSRTPAPNG